MTCQKISTKFSMSGNSHEILFGQDYGVHFSATSYKYNNAVCDISNTWADIGSTPVKISIAPDWYHEYTLRLDTDSGGYYCYDTWNESNVITIDITEFKVDDVDITNQLSPTTPQ